jgi:DNA polymerase III alpha subunit
MTKKQKAVLPQLRVRSEYSFRQGFGPLAILGRALADAGVPAAGMVDSGGTWGHATWAKTLKPLGIKPMFGAELIVPQGERKPVAWALAEDTRAFYRFTTAAQVPDRDITQLFRESSKGVLRFAGAALTDPDAFDYIDLNPSSPLQQRLSLELHKRTKKPLVITSDNLYPRWEDYGAFMAIARNERATPQFLLREDELRKHLTCLDARKFNAAVANTHEAASRAAGALPRAEVIHFDGDLRAIALAGREERLRLGHISVWTETHQARMELELAAIEAKGYGSYFLVVNELIRWSKQRMLVGPGRGSSAGSLICYLLRITEVDPLEHDLLFDRFIDVSRKDLPDIDIDFSSTKRELIFGHLEETYGKEKVARIGNISRLLARSVIARVCEKMGIPEREKFDVLNVLIEYSSGDSRYGHSLEDTMAQTDPGRKFIARHPEAAVMFQLENHASHTSVHAAGVIVCNEAISELCTVSPDGVIQGDKSYAEAVGLLKIDALGLRTLGVLEDAGCVTADELYGLKLNDPRVFDLLNQHRFAGVFQFEGQAQRKVSSEINIDSFRRMDHITALARPGPLGGGATNHYIARAAGREQVTLRHPSMAEYLGPTMGVVLYQEQVMRICYEIGQFDWETVNQIRRAMSGSKGKEYFDQQGEKFARGAKSIGVPQEDAQLIWDEICTFGAWGMNKSHTVSYSTISYWCAWMKVYHPLEYFAASLRNAMDEDQAYGLLRELAGEGIEYVAFDIDKSDLDWAAVGGKLIGGFMNLVGVGPAKGTAAIAARAAGKLNREKFLGLEVRFAELHPLQAAYGDIYRDPEAHGCQIGSRITRLDALPPSGGPVLTICKVLRKAMRDKNEAVLVKRRDGEVLKGQTLFADIFVTDDSGVPITLRINPRDFEPMGRAACERLQTGDALLVRGKAIPGFSMITVQRMKVLNREENFDA